MRRAALLLIAAAFLGIPAAASATDTVVVEPGTPQIDVVELAGVLDRPLMRYALDRLDEAEERKVRLLVFQLDSIGAVKVAPEERIGPSGVAEKPVPELIDRVMNARVPVAVHIGPRRAHAGGAALMLVAAAHVASIGPSGRVLAPTPIDAAHPERDAAGDRNRFVRYATARGRTPDHTARFPMGANAALAAGLVDLVVPSLPELFTRVNGRAVRVSIDGPSAGPPGGREITLNLPEDAVDVRFHQPGPLRRFAHALADPALLYLLVLAAVMLAVFELFQKGFGVAGGTAILLGACAIFGLTIVPATLLGGALLLAGMALLTFDVIRNEMLWPTWLGLAAFLAGSLTWLPDGQGALRLSPWLAATGTVGAFIFFVPVMTFVRRSALPREISSEVSATLIGGAGMVRSMLNPEGYVVVEGELWRARSADGTRVRVGEHVVVAGIEGTTLLVQGAPSEN